MKSRACGQKRRKIFSGALSDWLGKRKLLAILGYGLAALTAILSIQPALNFFSRNQLMNYSWNRFHLVNAYGAFGSITKERYEIVIEGSHDGETWKEYEFKAKPGDPNRMPPQVAPYHLRLDWLMWFAAMPSPYVPSWLIHLLGKLLEGDAATLALLRGSPFPDAPPKYVRALYYRYRFTTFEERRRSGCWWHRELVGTYFPPVSLDDPEFREILGRMGFD